MNKLALQIAAIFGGLGVILGAFGAHKLKEIITDPKLINSWETGVKYQMYHAIMIAIVAILQSTFKSSLLQYSIWMFVTGIILFSGSIYLLVFLQGTQNIGLKGLGIITPIGGVILILGWLFILLGLKK
jgi:uncharacterized membrane protein YgdD (TMEM256/DUF423 family)